MRVGLYIISGEEESKLASAIKRFFKLHSTLPNEVSSLPEPAFFTEPLREAKYVLVICSKVSLSSELVRSEIHEAIRLGKRIFCGELESGSVPEELNASEVLDFSLLRDWSDKTDATELGLYWDNWAMRMYWVLLPLIREAQSETPTSASFFDIWGSINWFERASSALLPLAVVVFLALTLPWFGAPLIRQHSSTDSSNFKVVFVFPETREVTTQSDLQLEIPSTMTVSETKEAIASLRVEKTHKPPSARLQSVSFDITSVTSETLVSSNQTFSWAWLITPKQVGQYAVLLRIEGAKLYSVSEGKQNRGLKIQGDSIVAPITVLTELGITSAQTAALKALGAFLGILGTILSYPIWRLFFENRLKQSNRLSNNAPATRQRGQSRGGNANARDRRSSKHDRA